MQNDLVQRAVAATVIVGGSVLVTTISISLIEQIRKDRAARKTYEALTEASKIARDMFVSEKFEQIIKENDL